MRSVRDRAEVAGDSEVRSLAIAPISDPAEWERDSGSLGAEGRPTEADWERGWDRPGQDVQRSAKRCIDVLVSACGLVVLSPLLLLIAALVRLDSAGPALFRQVRIGRFGKVFTILKFRTMTDGADGLRESLLQLSIYRDPRLFKIPQDPRVTRLGRLLRRTSLDELPQLWNVLRGEMSLVGPRPPLPNEVDFYEASHFKRLDVLPGITGPWQVAGRNLIRDFDHVLALETAYIEDWTLAKDFRILVKTIPVVLMMRGAH